MSPAFDQVADSVLYSLKASSLAGLKRAVREEFPSQISDLEFDSKFQKYVSDTSEFFSNELKSHIDDLIDQYIEDNRSATGEVILKDINDHLPPESSLLYSIFGVNVQQIVYQVISEREAEDDS